MLKHFANPPNWFTSAGLFCGLYSIILSTGVEGDPNFYRAAVMILFAGVFDMLDGGVARITKTGSQFGVQLDSLTDIVSFGIAPSVLLYAWGIHSLGTLGLVGAFLFCLFGAFRLARFNLDAGEDKPQFSIGLTITCAGGTVATAVMAHAASGRTSVEHPINVLILALILGWLMVSKVQYRTLKSLRLGRGGLISLSLFFGSILVIAMFHNLSTAFVSMALLYVALGPIEGLIRGRRSLATHGDFHVGDDFDGDD